MNAEAKTILKTLTSLISRHLSVRACSAIKRPSIMNMEWINRATFIEVLPKIDLNGRIKPLFDGMSASITPRDAPTRDSVMPTDGLDEKPEILQLSTFKRKKPKMRKDRARTVRRRIKRKSEKKRGKYNL